MLKRLVENDSNGDSLPWINEYLDSVGESGDASRVVSLKITLKGILVVCEDFKGFLFKNSKTYDAIVEAIPVWKTQKELPFAVFGIAEKNGKLSLAVDSDFASAVLIDKKGNVDFKSPNGDSASAHQEPNPFLMNLVTPPTTESAEEKKSTVPSRRKQIPL